ncbi:hypothetical protein AB0F13_22820 [Streptomyces sp. NPDC026206]|uniref:hypothetical protein n=1 Tax=Streptomyces sp. NPDC026206 TaxID=3157089 RepID=UPI00340462B5
MHRRTAPRLARILACAAVPVMLVATGCSSDGDSGSKKESGKPTKSATPSAAPTVKAATFAKLPEVCKTVAEKSVEKLVPKADKKEGKALPASDTNDSASCFWSGLNDEDVKDLQFRSLTVSLKRFASDPTLGSGEKRAEAFAAQQVTKATTADGAKNAKTDKADGIGESASVVSTESKKDDNDFRNETVVTRTANVVVVVKYSGAGYEGAKSPNVDDMKKDAQEAAKEAVKSVAEANK